VGVLKAFALAGGGDILLRRQGVHGIILLALQRYGMVGGACQSGR